MAPKPFYKRVLLKVSGEALQGSEEPSSSILASACEQIARSIEEVRSCGVQVAVVVGGGNIFRGSQAEEFGFAKTPADHIGMLGTAINGLVLQQSLARIGCPSRVMTALHCAVIEPYHWPQALATLDSGEVLIFVGGTGNPYFTTDTAAALRACEMRAEILLKGTKVGGIYSADPRKDKDAMHYDVLTYSEVFAKNLKVMDAAAIALCRDNRIPIRVFNLFETGALLRSAVDNAGGSLVTGE